MNPKQVYLSTIASNAAELAEKYGLGLEIAEFCTACHLDEDFDRVDSMVRKKMNSSDRFVLHAPFNELFPCAIDPKARELARCRYRQAIALAQNYGASKVVIHGGYHPRMYYPVWYTEQSILFWKEFTAEIPEGMVVCLENVLEEEPMMLLDIIKGVDQSKLRMCLDIGHVNAYSGIPVMDWLEACGAFLSHFHIHNNDGSWDTHSALPEGTIPVAELLNRAERLCPDATFTLELPEAESSIQWLMDNHLI